MIMCWLSHHIVTFNEQITLLFEAKSLSFEIPLDSTYMNRIKAKVFHNKNRLTHSVSHVHHKRAH